MRTSKLVALAAVWSSAALLLTRAKALDLDIDDRPANPQRVRGVATRQGAYELTVSGNHAYVAEQVLGCDGLGGLRARCASA